MAPNNLTNRSSSHAATSSDGDAVAGKQQPESSPDGSSASQTEPEFLVEYEGNEYNIHEFLDSHPAGRSVLLPFRNRDLTKKFHEVGHSAEAKKILRKYKKNKTAEDLEIIARESGDRKKQIVDFNFVKKKLITPEDEYFVHKCFGFLALCSFLYRYAYVLPTTGNLGMDGSWLDVATLVVHFFLTFSSLIFHVIRERIPTRPLIIYEEYRLHAIVFTVRGVLVSLLGFYCQNMDVMHKRWLLALSNLSAHLLADYITKIYGTKGVTAVRNDGVLTFQYIGLFYSFYQIAAIGGIMTWNDRMGDLGFNSLIAIQSSAFLMTLKRKNLIRWYSHAFWYSLCLALSFTVMLLIKGPIFFLYPAILFFFRVKFNVNKYVLWSIYAVSLYYFSLAT